MTHNNLLILLFSFTEVSSELHCSKMQNLSCFYKRLVETNYELGFFFFIIIYMSVYVCVCCVPNQFCL